MTRLLFFIIFTCLSTVSLCQTVYPYRDIKLEKPSDYKETEPMALSAANFVLSTALAEKDEGREGAIYFLSSWMSGNKERFYMQGKITDVSSDRYLLGLFIAAMVKYTLENKAEAVNPINVDQNAARLVLAYSDDPKNNFKLKKKYRKALEKN